MPLSLDDLEKEFASEQFLLSPAAMVIAVESQKEVLQAKGREFNCLVLHNAGDSAANPFVEFLKHLESNKATLPNNTRYQLLYKTEEHWSTADVRIIEGQLEFFLFDAANALPYVLAAFVAIRANCPEAKLNYCGPGIQNDKTTCAYFALDHAVCLSKLPDLHEQIRDTVATDPDFFFNYINPIIDPILSQYSAQLLSRGVDRTSALDAVCTVQYIPCNNLPKTFGSLLKNTQSISMYKLMFSEKGYTRSNGKSLDAYIDRHTKFFRMNAFDPPKPQNDAIRFKKLKIQGIALEYLATHQDNWGATVQSLQDNYGPLFALTALANLQDSSASPSNEDEIAESAQMKMAMLKT